MTCVRREPKAERSTPMPRCFVERTLRNGTVVREIAKNHSFGPVIKAFITNGNGRPPKEMVFDTCTNHASEVGERKCGRVNGWGDTDLMGILLELAKRKGHKVEIEPIVNTRQVRHEMVAKK